MLMRKTFSRPDNWRMVLKQVPTEMVKLGVDSVGIILIISVFMGVIMTMQVVLNTENPMLPRYTTGLMLRDTYLLEFSSTIMCLLLAGKVGSNIASEIGSMRVSEQIDAMEIMGVNSANYLILPKVLGLVLFMPVLVTFCVALGLLGGAGVGWFFYGDTLLSQMNMKKAEECFAADEMEDALEYYEKALERDETLTDAYLKINEIYVKDGKYEDAIAILTNGMDTIEAVGDYVILQQALKSTYEEARAHLDVDTVFELLEDVKDYFSEDTYNDEKGLLYLYKSSDKVVEQDFLGALLVIEEGEADVVNYNFGAQKAHIYEEYADFYMEKDNYDSALAVLNEGYDATGYESLLLKMKIAYKGCARSALETENYTYAHTLLYECYDKTGDETLLDDIANVYLANAEKFLEDGIIILQ